MVKAVNGVVEYLMKTGNDMVKACMPEEAAQKMVDEADLCEITDTFSDFPLCVNEQYYFPVVKEPEKAPKAKKAR